MKKRQGIRWKECSGVRSHGSATGERSVSLIAETLLDAVCAMIFLYATRTMIADVYGWGGFSAQANVMICIGALGVSFVMEYLLGLREELAKKLRWAVLGVGSAVFLYWLSLGNNSDLIRFGWHQIVKEFVVDWNSYYGTSFKVSNFIGAEGYVSEALDYLLLMTFFVLLWVAKRFKMNLIMAALPILVFVLELMVGYSAGEKGLFMMAGGLLLANTSAWRGIGTRSASGTQTFVQNMVQSFSWIIVGVVIICSFSLVKVVGTTSADKLVHSASEIRGWFDELFSDVPKGSGIGNGDGEGTGNLSYVQELNNSTPRYRYVPVFSVNMDSSPLGTLYFKGMYADVYEDGVWLQDIDSFNALLERTGMEASQLSTLIASREVNHLLNNYSAYSLADSLFGKRIQMKFERMSGQSIYLPYFAEIRHGQISAKGDSYFYRTGSISELEFTVWYYENQYQDRLDELSRASNVANWERQYESYVLDHYVNVPDELIAVRDIAAQLSRGSLSGEYSGNDLRLYRAAQVASWMAENTEYSLELPELPEGADPIEFFLLESRTGYCMHYASASVMILRAMGVPARYASGYVTGVNSFVADEDGWTAEVLDSQAHAWVEIYLYGIGWVPYEVTKGYQGSLPDFNPNDNPTGESEGDNDPTEPSTSVDDRPDRPDRTTEDDPAASSQDDVSTDSGNIGGGFRIDLSRFLRPILIVVGSLLVCVVVLYVILRIRHEYREQLMREIRRKRTSHAIQMMNRRIYRKLRMTGKVVKLNLRDDGYEEILKKTYTEIPKEDWEKYMEIAKKAAFSNQEFQAEEVKFFYSIYRKVKPRS